MEKGFVFGVILGACAISAYSAGCKVKNTLDEKKTKIKSIVNKVLD